MGIWDIGTSTWGNRYSDISFFETCALNEIKHVEISPAFNYRGIDVLNKVYNEIDFKQIKKFADETGINLWSYHLPFDPEGANLVSLDKEIRDYSVEICCDMIRKVSDIGINLVVLHPSVGGYEGDDRVERMKYSKDSVYNINKVAKECGITVALENLPPRAISSRSSDLLEMLKVDDSLKVCFDVNHIFLESHKNFIDTVGDRIVTLHISDYDFEDERHWLLGEGKIDWAELISLLKSINYQGVFMNEINASCNGKADGGKYTLSQLKEANEKILKKYVQK